MNDRVRASNDSLSDPLAIFIPTLTAGGAERVASILANEWVKSHRVVVITFFNDPHFYSLDESVEVICLGFVAGQSLARRSTDIARAAIRLRRIAKSVRPKFVLSFMNKYNAFCLAALAGAGVPVIVSERDSPFESIPLARRIARDVFYPRAAGLICQTQVGLEYMRDRIELERTVAIPNPVSRLLHEEWLPQPIVLTVGRLVPKKGHDQLLMAFADAGLRGWKLTICGDGPQRGDLQELAIRLGISQQVEFAGLTKNLGSYFRSAGIFAFSSHFEGFPNALAEALVSGLPCVSYDCPTGPAELIQHEQNGLLVDLGDIKGLSSALVKLAENRSLAERLGRTAAALGTSLSEGAVAVRYLEFCMKCVDGVRAAETH